MTHYRGRFAPSPTGPLHFGSLFAAVVSYLDAKAHSGNWIIRIEDIDPLREYPGATESILRTLALHGLHSDENILYQSTRSESYESVLSYLQQKKQIYSCPCSRKYLAEHGGKHLKECGQNGFTLNETALKFRSQSYQNHIDYWSDLFQGKQSASLNEDFVLKRKEGFYAYQLAVVCDDIHQQITHVIRGYDLIDSTPMQLALYSALDKLPPVFGHFPIIMNDQGQKLSKQTFAPAIDESLPTENLRQVLHLLNIECPSGTYSCEALLDNAILQWQRSNLRNKLQITERDPPRSLQQ